METRKDAPVEKVGFRPDEFARAIGASKSLVYEYMAAGRIKSRKLGTSRIIVTKPDEFLASLPEDGPRPRKRPPEAPRSA